MAMKDVSPLQHEDDMATIVNDIQHMHVSPEGDVDPDLSSDDYESSSDDEALEEVAPYACAYCGLADVNCVVKCLTCSKWYVFT